MNAFRLPKSLLGLVAAFGLSLGVVVGSMHDHRADDAGAQQTEVCVLSAGNVIASGAAASSVELTPPVTRIATLSHPVSPSSEGEFSPHFARGPPTIESYLV